MVCIKPITLPNGITVPCGHCMSCRVNYTSAWKLRLLYELSNWDKALFLTLTYDDEHLPDDLSIHKKELSAFFKRLRSELDYDGKGKIKYYACGEYGEKGGLIQNGIHAGKFVKRPHYHAIVFGLSPYSEEDKDYIINAWQHRCSDWQFDRSRGKKRAIQPVCSEDIGYVTGYVQKKLSGDMGKEAYGDKEHPFSLMSKGLGLDFALQNADRLRQNGFTYMNGHKICLPRYYRDKLGISVNYESKPKKTTSEVDMDMKVLEPMFSAYLQKHCIDIKPDSPEHCEQLARYFERFYESHRWELADQVLNDFQQRCKLTRNGI